MANGQSKPITELTRVVHQTRRRSARREKRRTVCGQGSTFATASCGGERSGADCSTRGASASVTFRLSFSADCDRCSREYLPGTPHHFPRAQSMVPRWMRSSPAIGLAALSLLIRRV